MPTRVVTLFALRPLLIPNVFCAILDCHTAVPKWPLIDTAAGAAAGSMSSRVQSSVAFLEKVATPKLTFYADNALVLPLWLGMIFKPNNALVRAAMEGYVAIIIVSLG
jgi:hypothetical protein